MPTVADRIGEGRRNQRGIRYWPPTRVRVGRVGEWGRLGAYVRDERRRRGQTQREFAGRVGLSVRTVGALERGELDRYDANTLALVELALAWRPGSAEHVLAGGKPKTADPHLAAIRAAWPRLSREAREMLARLATDIADHHPR